MYTRVLVSLAILGFVVALVRTEETVAAEEAEHDKNVIPQSSQPRLHAGDLSSLHGGFLSLLSNGGTLAAGILAVAALAALILPILGIKICYLLGNCDHYQGYAAGQNSVYSDYGNYQQGTYNNPVYQKRSIEYIGPILKALGNAYEKYSRQTTSTAAPITKNP